MKTIQDQLARLHNRSTLYEIIVTDGVTTMLVCYAPNSGSSFIKAMQSRIGKMAIATGTRLNGWSFINRTSASCEGWTAKLSGRTQRDSISNGEHTFINTLAESLSQPSCDDPGNHQPLCKCNGGEPAL